MQNIPGVFDRTGGDLSSNGVHLGLCLDILGERSPSHARIGDVVKCLEKGGSGGGIGEGARGFFVLMG